MDDGLHEPVRATRLLAWAAAGLLVAGAASAGAVAGHDPDAGGRVVSAAGVDADGVEVPTTVTTILATTVVPTVPPTTAEVVTTTSTAPKPTTTTTRAPRPTTTTAAPAAPSTTTAGVLLTVVNSSTSAVTLKVNDRSFSLAPGQKAGPVPITRYAHGNDIIELRLAQEPTCGMGDADGYFPKPGSYLLTIVSSPGSCNLPSGAIPSVSYRVTPA